MYKVKDIRAFTLSTYDTNVIVILTAIKYLAASTNNIVYFNFKGCRFIFCMERTLSLRYRGILMSPFNFIHSCKVHKCITQ